MEEIIKMLLTFLAYLGKFSFAIFILKSKGMPEKGIPSDKPRSGAENSLKLSSSAFGDDQNIPVKYTCDGQNISPPLKIDNVPMETQSLALIMHDPDAAAEGGWTHWIVFNIPPNITDITEDSVPEGSIEGVTSSGINGYSGPCPPSGTHHYEFSLYALDSRLVLDDDATKSNLQHAMEGHIISQYTLTGLYSR